MKFEIGNRVITSSGYTKGVVILVPDEHHIDVKSDAGPLYRNCLLTHWLIEGDYNGPSREPVRELARGDRCYISAKVEGEAMSFAGYVVTVSRDRLFIAFDDGVKSQWVERKSVTRGEPPE